ncbi:hypothetical protein IEQ34_004080 [Dendrobium chrysotoxum]|uniref:Uncharacterized protein n=1 Tax=Dendrobium chrysotoxum TaxID=161865 RepID=A0AAV7HD66_DENCH|nr:hypothetical protein IEQ34_004080 [Dendrobium chrysotoxum]
MPPILVSYAVYTGGKKFARKPPKNLITPRNSPNFVGKICRLVDMIVERKVPRQVKLIDHLGGVCWHL